MENNCYPFTNTPLPYAYDALEPYIDEKTMHLHHDKHLQTYINNLNNLLKDCSHLQKLSLVQLIKSYCKFPNSYKNQLRIMQVGYITTGSFLKDLQTQHKMNRMVNLRKQ